MSKNKNGLDQSGSVKP